MVYLATDDSCCRLLRSTGFGSGEYRFLQQNGEGRLGFARGLTDWPPRPLVLLLGANTE